MLNPTTLQSFFEQHQIPLKADQELELEKIDEILSHSSKLGQSFKMFIASSAIDTYNKVYTTDFQSYDHLYESYAYFMIGNSECAKC